MITHPTFTVGSRVIIASAGHRFDGRRARIVAVDESRTPRKYRLITRAWLHDEDQAPRMTWAARLEMQPWEPGR